MPPNAPSSHTTSSNESKKKTIRWFIPRVHIIREEVAISHRNQLVGEYVRGEIDERTYTVMFNYALESQATNRALWGGRSEDVYEEEYERIYSRPSPVNPSRIDLAAAAAEAARRKVKMRLRSDCTLRSDSPSPLSSPSHRLSLFTSCFNSFCQAQVDELAVEAGAPRRLPPCVFCAEYKDLRNGNVGNEFSFDKFV